MTPAERIDLLVATVKAELTRGAIGHDTFSGRVVQLWFDSQDAEYPEKKKPLAHARCVVMDRLVFFSR